MARFARRTTLRLAALASLFAFLAGPALHEAAVHAHADCPVSDPTCVGAGVSEQFSAVVSEFCPFCLLARQGRILVAPATFFGVSAPGLSFHAVPSGAIGVLAGLPCLAYAAPRAPPPAA